MILSQETCLIPSAITHAVWEGCAMNDPGLRVPWVFSVPH